MTLKWLFKKNYGPVVTVFVIGGSLLTILISCFIVVGSNKTEVEATTSNVQLAFIIFRHGDRSPTDLYPKDPHINHIWPGGLGALSKTGISQLFNLGKTLNLRYKTLLTKSEFYSQNFMLVLSSYAERCIMSAQSFLASFMPPLNDENPLPINWQPIPVNVLPRDKDDLLAQKKSCPKYDMILADLYKNPPPDILELNEKNKNLYKILNTYTGKNFTTILDVELLYNTLEIEENNGLILPDWTKNIYPENMLTIAERSLTLFTETDEMKKMKAGPIITQIYENMRNKTLGTLKPDRNIFIYSGHDTTLINIMNSLNILNQTSTKPKYASALIFELHRNMALESNYEVKIFYYIDSNEKFPKAINIPNCSKPCTLSKFEKIINHLIVKDYDGICKLLDLIFDSRLKN